MEGFFQGRKISAHDSFRRHLNRYDVIRIDVQWCLTSVKSGDKTVSYIEKNVIEELRGLFKGANSTEFIHLAYLTGILSIKKIRTQSALNDFDEFTMLDAKIFAPYIGFTEEEVKSLCGRYGRDFEETKCWYDGYLLGKEHVYNPKAVLGCMMWGEFRSYWSMTGTFESIRPLINMDFDGLRTAVITMLAGESVRVKTTSYQNDMVTFRNKDEVGGTVGCDPGNGLRGRSGYH